MKKPDRFVYGLFALAVFCLFAGGGPRFVMVVLGVFCLALILIETARRIWPSR